MSYTPTQLSELTGKGINTITEWLRALDCGWERGQTVDDADAEVIVNAAKNGGKKHVLQVKSERQSQQPEVDFTEETEAAHANTLAMVQDALFITGKEVAMLAGESFWDGLLAGLPRGIQSQQVKGIRAIAQFSAFSTGQMQAIRQARLIAQKKRELLEITAACDNVYPPKQLEAGVSDA